jgi:hypothetical protein
MDTTQAFEDEQESEEKIFALNFFRLSPSTKFKEKPYTRP